VARKCPAATYLSSREFDEVKAVPDGSHQPRKGPWYCEYPAATMHFQHTAVVQQVPPANPADLDNEPDPLWLVWSDDGRRSLRWLAPCPTLLPSPDDTDGLYCVLFAKHGGDCDSDQDNEYQPSAEMQKKLTDTYHRLQAILTARAMGCPTLVIRDDEHAQDDFARWSQMDHAVTCPPEAVCHQAAALLDAGDEAGFQALLDRYRP
jgi:hypothetical protein